jgi:hypothetical protein
VAAALAIGVRQADPVPGAVDRALADGLLMRMWAMRGTLHLLPAAEHGVWAGARTDYESRRRFPPSWEREHGVTGAQLHAITDAVAEVLGAEPMTRAELAAAVSARLGDPALTGPLSTGWGALLKPAAARGLLCSGPAADDGAVTFVAPAAWLGAPVTPLDTDAANREILLRFLAAGGPATPADVARWWGEQPAPARRWAKANADALAAVEVDGEGGYLVRAEDAEELADTPDEPAGDVVLLPGFDPWVIAPRSHRDRAVPAGFANQVSRTAGWISPVLVVDGVVAGVWEHEVRRDRLAVTVRPFAPLPRAVRVAAEAHARRYGELLDASDVTVDWS